MLYIPHDVGIFPLGFGFLCHLSSYSFHILVMTFAGETVVDWPVFLSAVRVFVTATEGHSHWCNRLNAAGCAIKVQETCLK